MNLNNSLYDLEAERQVIGAGLQHNVRVIESLNAEWLTEPRLRLIYTVMRDMRVEGLPTEPVAVMTEIKNRNKDGQVDLKYLAEVLVDGALPATLPTLIERLGMLWKQRRMRSLCEDISNVEEDPNLLKQYQEELTTVLSKRVTPPAPPSTVGEAGERYWERCEGLTDNGDDEVVTTGFPIIDESAELREGELTTVAARPGMGKSALALQMAYNAALTGKRTLIISLEMTESGIMQRLFSMITGIEGWKFRKGQLNTEEWNLFTKALTELRTVPLHISDGSLETVDTIRAKVKYLQEFYNGCDEVVIDYMQLMSGVKKTDNRTLEVSEISRGLKVLAKDEDLAIVALSQLSREVEKRQNKRPMLADLRESGSIEQDSDQVIFIYRDDYYNPDSIDRGTAEIIVAKQRNGQPTTLKLGWRPNTTQFVSLYTATTGSAAS